MGRKISKEEMALFKNEEFTGEIIEVISAVDADKAVDYLLQFKVLGFDTETRPSFKKGSSNEVALIQLATDKVCFLFRLNLIGFPKSLIGLLSNPNTLKIGLSLRDDYLSMGRKMKFAPAGFIDLQKEVVKFDIEDLSLQKIYALLFNKKISKNQRLSNWEAEELTEPQKKYAALDAWACLKIYEKLCQIKESI